MTDTITPKLQRAVIDGTATIGLPETTNQPKPILVGVRISPQLLERVKFLTGCTMSATAITSALRLATSHLGGEGL